MLKKVILALIFLVSFSSAYAMESLNVDFTIAYNRIHVQQNIVFDKETQFNLTLPEDAQAISLYLDGKEAEFKNQVFAKEIILKYLTEQFIDNENFIADLNFPDDVKKARISVALPDYAVLTKPIDKSTLASNAVFPKPTKIESDGQRIMITWELENLKKNDSLALLVMYQTKKNYYPYLIVPLVIIIAALALYIIFKKPKKIVEKERIIEKHLKEDEEQVVNILKQREGKIEQGTLRVITGFSKAKLSALLKEMEERNIVYKEKIGKKNLVFLK